MKDEGRLERQIEIPANRRVVSVGAAVRKVTDCLSQLLKESGRTDEGKRNIFLPFILNWIPPLTGVCLSGFPWEVARRSPSQATKADPTGLANVGPPLLQAGSWHGAQREAATLFGSASHETPAAPSAGSRRLRLPAAERRVERV